MMERQELLKFSKEELIDKLHSRKMLYNKAMYKYRDLKGDLIVLKKRLLSITDNIHTGESFDKGNSLVRYYPSGKYNSKTINPLQKSRVENKRGKKECLRK